MAATLWGRISHAQLRDACLYQLACQRTPSLGRLPSPSWPAAWLPSANSRVPAPLALMKSTGDYWPSVCWASRATMPLRPVATSASVLASKPALRVPPMLSTKLGRGTLLVPLLGPLPRSQSLTRWGSLQAPRCGSRLGPRRPLRYPPGGWCQ